MSLPPEIVNPIKDFISKNWTIIIIVVSCIMVGYASVIFMDKDNLIEQEVEKVIEAETGIHLDLTPSEDKNKV